MEKLYAEFLLWLIKLNTNEKYENLLHEYFLSAPNDKVLLELEECSSDILRTNAILENYWDSEHKWISIVKDMRGKGNVTVGNTRIINFKFF